MIQKNENHFNLITKLIEEAVFVRTILEKKILKLSCESFPGVSVAKLKLEDVIRPLLPFYAAIIVAVLLVTYIPQISMFLPRLLGL